MRLFILYTILLLFIAKLSLPLLKYAEERSDAMDISKHSFLVLQLMKTAEKEKKNTSQRIIQQDVLEKTVVYISYTFERNELVCQKKIHYKKVLKILEFLPSIFNPPQ